MARKEALMGVIKRCEAQDYALLNMQHVIGRNFQIANTCIPEKDVSKSHATILWKNGSWYLQDHSRNGTIVNDKYIHHSSIKLKKGALIQFGQEKSSRWELIDVAAPASYLKSLKSDQDILALTSCPGLPNPDHPEVSFFYSKDNRWRAETAGK